MENEFTFCQKCGEKNTAENNFCQRCAAPLKEMAQPAQQAQPQFVPPAQPQWTPPAQQQAVPPVQPQYNPLVQQQWTPPKKKKNGLLIIALVVAGIVALIIIVAVILGLVVNDNDNSGNDPTKPGTSSNSGDMRNSFTSIVGSGKDKVTVMLNIIGSNLESGGAGCATADINEMLQANLGSNVNLVIQTGGAASWENSAIRSGTCQRFAVENRMLVEKDDLGLVSMVEPDTVTGFISWSAKNYPANRYCIIFWDHGGGTVSGYGSDEYFEGDTLELSDLSAAMKNGGIKFDFVGFDACLMGTIETAYTMEPYADYLIASEDLEPGTGWYYTNWLNAFGSNPSIQTVDLAKTLIDDFVNAPGDYDTESRTLAVTELREIPGTYEKMCTYMANSAVALNSFNYTTISTARADAKDFGDGGFEQIDIIDYVNKAGVDGSDALKSAIGSAVKYTNNSISSANGLAMYYPFDYPDYYDTMLKEFKLIGYGDECTEFFDKFMSIMAGGESMAEGAADSPLQTLTGVEDNGNETDYSQYSWFDQTAESSYSDIYASTQFEMKEIIDKGDYYALPMTDEDWDLITYVEMQVFLDDGEGFVDLGGDNRYNLDDAGDLKVDFDYTWVAIDGQTVPFYAEYEEYNSETDWYTYGYVPAVLNNGDDIEIVLYWDNEYPDGFIAGYRYQTEDFDTAAKGLKDFYQGDVIEFYCDYYMYDGTYDGQYYYGDPVTIGSSLPAVSYEDIGEYNTEVCFMLTDIYNNNYWTETVDFTI